MLIYARVNVYLGNIVFMSYIVSDLVLLLLYIYILLWPHGQICWPSQPFCFTADVYLFSFFAA